MDKVVKTLKVYFYAPIVIALLLVVLYETEVILPGSIRMDANLNFLVLSLMEILMLAVIPAALYLFKMKRVHNQLIANPVSSMRRYGILRLLMLGVPLVANTDLYYMSMNTAYGYMAIVLLIVMPFVYPSKSRCEEETGKD
jgi:hypothetical protein